MQNPQAGLMLSWYLLDQINGEGIKLFINGEEKARDTTKGSGTFPTGDGRIVLGRGYTDQDQDYASVMIDELIYFNKALTDEENHVLV